MNVAHGGTSGLLCPKYNKQKVKYSTEATVVRLVGSIQAMEMQAVVDEVFREYQTSGEGGTRTQPATHAKSKWPPGALKWPAGSEKRSDPRLLEPPINFC